MFISVLINLDMRSPNKINKRSEMELSLNHYCLALHGLPPLEPEEPEVNYDFEEPDEPGEI